MKQQSAHSEARVDAQMTPWCLAREHSCITPIVMIPFTWSP